MAGIMQYLRACGSYGCAVVILHHPAKVEGSTGRGSSAIRGACDLAFLHSLNKESGLITLKADKNRHGESRTITLRADFEDGRFWRPPRAQGQNAGDVFEICSEQPELCTIKGKTVKEYTLSGFSDEPRGSGKYEATEDGATLRYIDLDNRQEKKKFKKGAVITRMGNTFEWHLEDEKPDR